ncbi:hypothetical protein Purlil1_5262 [Purpureocillium lilacinum]|uniref:Uncharacterized protein n=1 Tax=Purpureocillium lilacinum TaxID=33203 RepID=A0ABR0C2Z1_PURLI|nr:hypothetical protein Purlil1_5262 [Purpureocillium lilacinum]
MNIACQAPFEANWKVSVGVLDEEKGKAGNAKPRKVRQSRVVATSKTCEAPSREQATETSLSTNSELNGKSLPGTAPIWSVEEPTRRGQDLHAAEPAPSTDFPNAGLLPWNSTWDFDFSLDPWLDYTTPFSDFPSWNPDNTQLPDDTTLSTPTSLVSSTNPQPLQPPQPIAPAVGDATVVHRQAKRLKQTPALDSHPTPEQNINQDEFFFQHYEHCISGWAYSLKDDGKGNYLRFVLDFIRDPQCHAESPFRLAVLAWTAKHWAVACQPGDDTWRQYYSRATAALQRLEEQGAIEAPDACLTGQKVMASTSEVVICASLFLCRCDVLNDDLGSILDHLETLKQQLVVHLDGTELSAFASQILLWLGYLHVRVSIFTPSPAVNSHGVSTTLLDAIASHSDYQQILDRSQSYLSEIFGDSYPAEELLQDAEKAPVAVRTHETFCLIANMLRYRSWKRVAAIQGDAATQLELENAKVEAINVDIRRMDVEFGLAMATNPSAAILREICFQQPAMHVASARSAHPISYYNVNPTASPVSVTTLANLQLVSSPGSTGVTPPERESMLEDAAQEGSLNRTSSQWLACYAVFLTAKILWSRLLHPTSRSESSAATAVKSILDIALHLRRAHESSSPTTSWPHKMPRSMLWPLPLFVAGVETTDEIHADWIRGFMNEVTSSWGGEVAMSAKGRELHGNGGQRGNNMSSVNRVQTLMGRVRRLQDQLGCRVDIEGVVREMSSESGGGFIL